MSVQFGKCNFDGRPLDPKDLDEVRPVLAPYGPDGEGYLCKENFGVIYRAFHTTKESRNERQPYISPSGFVVTWDGRLDNREELTGELRNDISPHSTDLDIVVAAYQQWGTKALATLIGDWALSIWNSKEQSLILAKDFIGCRPLYYSVRENQVSWCSIPDALVLLGDRPLRLEFEYIAGWLAAFPASHLSPFVGIHSVPPSSFVYLGKGTERIVRYWDFDPNKEVLYHSDSDYEEHFRNLFRKSVRRRLRSDIPILAELSGGMDSTSIVCVADTLARAAEAEMPRLNTISYYNDSEPNWDERPYFTKVEQQRARTGHHIDLGAERWSEPEPKRPGLFATPGALGRSGNNWRQLNDYVNSQGYRVLLSGIGGDEFLGGVPTPVPELADCMVRGQFDRLARSITTWALNKRVPVHYLAWETVRAFLPHALAGTPPTTLPQPWLRSQFKNNYRAALSGYEQRLRFFGGRPSLQLALAAVECLRRQLGCLALPRAYETRYPYFDRNLLTFLFAIPADQLVRPGQRRSLMRRSLAGIVPYEILNRKRKGFVSRRPLIRLQQDWSALLSGNDVLMTEELGILDSRALAATMERASVMEGPPLVPLLRTFGIELWLRALAASGLITSVRARRQHAEIPVSNEEFS